MAPTLPLVASPFSALPSLTSFQSAVMAGFKVVAVKSLPDGSLDLVDLKEKAEKHRDNLAACMV
jgi:glycine dehydrogenase